MREGLKSKRSKVDLYATILEVIRRYPEGGRITRISYGVGVPVDRLKVMVEESRGHLFKTAGYHPDIFAELLPKMA